MYLSSGVARVALKKEKKPIDPFYGEVLKTKLKRPSVRNYLPRPRITKELDMNVHKPLTVVAAGAGYGKSIVVSQWLHEQDWLHAWVSIDSELNDLRTFLYYLVASIEDAIPGSMAGDQKRHLWN